MQFWSTLPQQAHRFEKTRGQVCNLGITAAWQNGQNRHILRQLQLQLLACCFLIWFHWKDIGQRMSDIGGGNAVLLQQGRFKWKQAQHMVCTAADGMHAMRAPGPDRRTHEMHRANALLTQVFFEAEIEIRSIHANKNVWPFLQKAFAQLGANAPQAVDALEHFEIVAMHCQQLAGPVCHKPLLRHKRTSDAAGLPVGPMLAYPLQQQAGQEIARSFPCHHADAQSLLFHEAQDN